MRSPNVNTRLMRDGIDPRFFDRRLMELRMLGLTYTDIVRVISFYEGWHDFTELQIRARLNRLGSPKNPNKARSQKAYA